MVCLNTFLEEPDMEWVDRKVLQQLADDIGQEMLPVVIAVFIEEVGEQLSQLRPLYEQGEWDALARVAHSMKSSCGSYGAMPSYQQVMALEMASKQADVAEAERQLQLLEVSLPQVLAFLADYQ
jgi:HPt (histidine-containing phosphotransfer) domain-containing protein